MTLCAVACIATTLPSRADSIATASGVRLPMEWRVGAELSPGCVPGTNSYLKGNNPSGMHINSSLSGAVRADFSYNRHSREGMLYRGAYQGLGIGVNSFFANDLLGTPVSAYVYQGAPIVHFNKRLWLGYEWQFGAAMGWKHQTEERLDDHGVVSTRVTAHMGIGLKMHYELSERWRMSVGLGATHYSNGNTSWPNSGVNSFNATIGVAYVIAPQSKPETISPELEKIADEGRWTYDLTAYGAWRKRALFVGDVYATLCPGKFGVAGIEFSPMRVLNRWVSVGPSLDVQWDESAGLAPYWVEGSYDEYVKFRRPPFCKQLSVGVSGHAELTMPIFSINAGLGYDIVNPEGNKRFYQSLTLKTFVSNKLYLNVGYRLGNFKTPQNLMLGVGVRL